MMPILNLLFLAVLCVILYGLFLAVWVGALFLLRTKHKLGYSLLSLPVFVILLVSWFFWQLRPAAVFKDSFGFAPSSDVTSMQSSQWILGDTGIVYLHFKAAPTTVQRVLSKGFVPAISGPSSTNSTPPDWWQPRLTGVREFTKSATAGNFAFEEEYLIHDPAAGEVWYRFIGID